MTLDVGAFGERGARITAAYSVAVIITYSYAAPPMRNRSPYPCDNTTGPKLLPNFAGMMVGTVAAGAMFTPWNYARQQTPYATLARGGAAVSIGQQLVRGAEGCLSVSGHAG